MFLKQLQRDDIEQDADTTNEQEETQPVQTPSSAHRSVDSDKIIKWTKVSLSDPTIKFAVLKRTAQLLGIRIPDPEIGSIRNARDLVHVLQKKPKTIKLEEEVAG